MKRLTALSRQTDGSVAIEFAMLAPLLITMLLGVFQIGLGMQQYNALRSIAAETARYAAVERQKGVTYTHTDVSNRARTIATGRLYGLQGTRLTTAAPVATTQRVSGATEYTLTITYNVPTFLGIIGMDDIPLSYTRPVFVV